MSKLTDALKYVSYEGGQAIGRLLGTVVGGIADRLYPLDVEAYAASERALAELEAALDTDWAQYFSAVEAGGDPSGEVSPGEGPAGDSGILPAAPAGHPNQEDWASMGDILGELLGEDDSPATEAGDPSEWADDPVNHPSHYTSGPGCPDCGRTIECIDVTERMPFTTGNAIKYLWRAGLKGAAAQDLLKARWYVNRELERLGVEA